MILPHRSTWSFATIFPCHDPIRKPLAGQGGSGQKVFDIYIYIYISWISGRVGSGRVGSGMVGSGRVGSGRVGSGRVGSGQAMLAISRVGSDRIGSDRIGSGRVGSGGIQISQVRLGHRRPTRPAKSGLTSEAKPLVLFLRERDRHLFVPQMSTIELFFCFLCSMRPRLLRPFFLLLRGLSNSHGRLCTFLQKKKTFRGRFGCIS